jgi:predicted RNA binding protein YcfA (HicA-like mRNA interferase family)
MKRLLLDAVDIIYSTTLMGRSAAKKLDNMRQNPRDWRIEVIVAVAVAFGFKARQGKGSHVVLTHPNLAEMLPVPAKKPIKPVYVRKLIELIDQTLGG